MARHPLGAGLLLAFLLGAYLFCSICHPTPLGGGTAGAEAQAAAQTSEPAHTTPAGDREETDDHGGCDDSGLLSADNRPGTASSVMLLALGTIPASALWSVLQQVHAWFTSPRTRVSLRSGTRLLLSLCIRRV